MFVCGEVRARVGLTERRRWFVSGVVAKGERSLIRKRRASLGLVLLRKSGTVCVAKGEIEKGAESSCSQTLPRLHLSLIHI